MSLLTEIGYMDSSLRQVYNFKNYRSNGKVRITYAHSLPFLPPNLQPTRSLKENVGRRSYVSLG